MPEELLASTVATVQAPPGTSVREPLRLLHTSDWHLGCVLYGKKRYEESQAFLQWLLQVIELQKVNVLLVSGDIFDTTTPSNRAQELYYDFLFRLVQLRNGSAALRHVVITAGNHDSPSFLRAPKDLLNFLHIHIIESATERPEDEVLELCDASGRPELYVCAVPFLRDRDIRLSEAAETAEQKTAHLREGIRCHYARVTEMAEARRSEQMSSAPIVAMGHLFTSGGQTVEGDGVRELYVGNLAHVESDVFSSTLAYVALGHLHVPQAVQNQALIRYSGSPLPIGFGEAGQEKCVCLLEMQGEKETLSLLSVPTFRTLLCLEGDLPFIRSELSRLVRDKIQAWLEITYTGDELVSNLNELLEKDFLQGTELELLRLKNVTLRKQYTLRTHSSERLEELSPLDVFTRFLESRNIPPAQRQNLIQTFTEAVNGMHEEDRRAE